MLVSFWSRPIDQFMAHDKGQVFYIFRVGGGGLFSASEISYTQPPLLAAREPATNHVTFLPYYPRLHLGSRDPQMT